MISAYALYRLPDSSKYTEVRQNDGSFQEFSSFAELAGNRGFVISPFCVSSRCPIVMIRPDVKEDRNVPLSCPLTCCDNEFTKEKDEYFGDFAKFHNSIKEGTFRKIVLSRKSEVQRTGTVTDKEIFFTACNLYPHMFVALVSSSATGTWLMATPEILLEGSGSEWHTMALAGTMRDGSEINWSEKNMREQKYVEDYIRTRLSPFVSSIEVKGPYTSHAGNLIHLRSDFTFRLNNPDVIGKVIECMHPTPAVCGLPKEDALKFITETEHSKRLYYSGFTGMLDVCDNTHLFVSLRCMKMESDKFSLYAGGGLLDASTVEKEWAETEAKMETMKKCIV